RPGQPVREYWLADSPTCALLSIPMAARIFALFVALLTLVNLLGDLLWPGFDANGWWISFRPLPVWISQLLLAISAVALTAFAFRRPVHRHRSHWIAGVAALLATVALA